MPVVINGTVITPREARDCESVGSVVSRES